MVIIVFIGKFYTTLFTEIAIVGSSLKECEYISYFIDRGSREGSPLFSNNIPHRWRFYKNNVAVSETFINVCCFSHVLFIHTVYNKARKKNKHEIQPEKITSCETVFFWKKIYSDVFLFYFPDVE